MLLFVVTPISFAFAPPGARLWQAPQRVCTRQGPLVMLADYYATLGVDKSATGAQIKQAYRRLALRNHPDVNKAADAQEVFANIAEAYSVLGDTKQRADYDAKQRYGPQPGRSSYGGAAGGASGARRGPASGQRDAAASDRQRRWREQNPTPDELGDSFGALLGDLVSAVGKAVAGGDWIDLLGDLQADGPELQTLLRSRDLNLLRDELEEAKWIEERLRSRQARLKDEAREAKAEAERYRARRRAAGSTVGRDVERQMERESGRWQAQAVEAERLMLTVQQRQRRIEARIAELRGGSGAGAGGAASGATRDGRGTQQRRKTLPSVEEELQRMKRDLGR